MTRPTCPACRRPTPLCLCGLAPVVQNRVGVTILQHPGERRHPFNTARLTRAALANAALQVVWSPDEVGPLPPGAVVLWPGADAVPLAELSPAHLVLLDGTWPQARALYRDVPALRGLPRASLAPSAPSRYLIRREPAAHFVSTIEAAEQALRTVDPGAPGLDRMLDAFLQMVQVQAGRASDGRRRQRERHRPSQLHRVALEWDRLVLGYAETLGFRGQVDRAEQVGWSAVRPSSGRTFQAVLVPLSGDFTAQWEAYLGADGVLACWSPHAPALLHRTTGRRYDVLPLRDAYGNLRRGVVGHLDEVTAREGCSVERRGRRTRVVPPRARGRPRVLPAGRSAPAVRRRGPRVSHRSPVGLRGARLESPSSTNGRISDTEGARTRRAGTRTTGAP